MQHNLQTDAFAVSQQTVVGGLAVRTGVRGGACVEVNDQVTAALQTLTDALGGATTATVAAPTTPDATAATGS